ncbi:MAG: trypsin-like peptidase domain-containing protein [Bacteriovoracaceae bacterium]|nr:trypsin-like peptidase domain-containing protein [Bacteriovoracaceae bacterium]
MNRINYKDAKKFFCFLICLILISCGRESEQQRNIVEINQGKSIVGDIDWRDINGNTKGSLEEVNAAAVGYLSLSNSRCTGFLISEKHVMTNQHCIGNQKEAKGTKLYLKRERGQSWWSREATYRCEKFITANEKLDFAIIECEGNPGKKHGFVKFNTEPSRQYDDIYLIHQNCDYKTNSNCRPKKKVGHGHVVSYYDKYILHNADSLGGSSGAPLFDQKTHKVIGLHNTGWNEDYRTGRGDYNGAIKISDIASYLEREDPAAYKLLYGSNVDVPDVTPFDFASVNFDVNVYQKENGRGVYSYKMNVGDNDLEAISSVDYSFLGSRFSKKVTTRDFSLAIFSNSREITAMIKVNLKSGESRTYEVRAKLDLPDASAFQVEKVDLMYEFSAGSADEGRNLFVLSLKEQEEGQLDLIEKVTYKVMKSNKYPTPMEVTSRENNFALSISSFRTEYEIEVTFNLVDQRQITKVFVIKGEKPVEPVEPVEPVIDASSFKLVVKTKGVIMYDGEVFKPFKLEIAASLEVLDEVESVLYFVTDTIANMVEDKDSNFSSPVYLTTAGVLKTQGVMIKLKNGKLIQLDGATIK